MINIVGAGLAGLSCAINLAKKGIKCNLISVEESYRAQSVMAEGGINGALNTMNENDEVIYHIEDTLKGGAFLGNEKAIKGLCENAIDIIYWLKDLGVPFESKDGKIVLRNFGGQKNKRTAYVKSSTGKMLMSALIDEARKYEVKNLIHRYDHHEVYDLLIENSNCIGLKMYDLFTDKAYELYGPVVLATGGLSGMFPGLTTGSKENTGRLLSRLFYKGLKLANLEMIQYHPTTIAISGKRLLVSEAARGEGARFMTYKDGKPYYFMEELYPEMKNLVTRDVASRTIYKIQNDPSCKGVYLDMRHIDDEIWNNRLSDMRQELMEYLNIDIAKEVFEIKPGIHYFMGGIYVDNNHHTSFNNLYAAGECACIYHGANRLGGNSLLGAIYGGKIVSENIKDDNSEEIKEIDNDYVCLSDSFSETVKDILENSLGIIRDEKTINNAINEVDELLSKDLSISEKEKCLLAKAMLLSALNRKESRGAHYRSDYPETDDSYKKTSVVSYNDDIVLDYVDIDGGIR